MPWGGIASAVGSIAGGLISNAGRKDNSEALAQMNYEHQKEFAQNGIRWKVADAKAAGIHPLAALGATTTSFSPGYVGGESSGQDYSWIADAGQGIGRAVEAGLSRKERAAMQATREQATQLDLDNRRAQLENQQLQNQALKMDMVRQMAQDAERAVIHQNQGPGIPTRTDGAIIDGQADATSSNLFTTKPAEIVRNDPGQVAAEAGSHPDVKYTRTSDGGYAIGRSSAVEEALEDDWLGSMAWNIRNRLAPTSSDTPSSAPPDSYLPNRKDYIWTFNPFKQAYYPVKRSDWFGRFSKRFNPF